VVPREAVGENLLLVPFMSLGYYHSLAGDGIASVSSVSTMPFPHPKSNLPWLTVCKDSCDYI
jgi:hypothetical protein